MNLLHIQTLCLFLLCFMNINGQNSELKDLDIYTKGLKASNNKYESSSSNIEISLHLDHKQKEFEITELSGAYDYHSVKTLMKGTFIKTEDQIICYTQIPVTRNYTLKIVNSEILLNETLPYFTADSLYITSKFKNGHRLFAGKWFNGKKEGRWTYFKDGKSNHYKIYKNGIVIEENNKTKQ